VTWHERGELVTVGLVGGEVGDAVHDFFVDALAVQPAGVADDPEDLLGAGEVDPGRGHDAELAFLCAAVTTRVLPGPCRILLAQLVDDGGAQLRLVAFDGHHVALAAWLGRQRSSEEQVCGG